MRLTIPEDEGYANKAYIQMNLLGYPIDLFFISWRDIPLPGNTLTERQKGAQMDKEPFNNDHDNSPPSTNHGWSESDFNNGDDTLDLDVPF